MTHAAHLITSHLIMPPVMTLITVMALINLVAMMTVIAARALMVSVGRCQTSAEQESQAKKSR